MNLDTYMILFMPHYTSNDILSVTNATYSDTVSGVSGTATLDTNPADVSVSDADNEFDPVGNPYLDVKGILLDVGGAYVNIWYCAGSDCGSLGEPIGYVDDEYANATDLALGYPEGVTSDAYGGTFTATDLGSTATPEPSSWLLLGSGLLALMGLAYRRGRAHFAASNL
jgi:hypothetical protein